MDIRNFATLSVLASISFFTGFAGAQDRIEDVVVTAEKREASLQDTAIAINAVSGDDLRALQLAGLGRGEAELAEHLEQRLDLPHSKTQMIQRSFFGHDSLPRDRSLDVMW